MRQGWYPTGGRAPPRGFPQRIGPYLIKRRIASGGMGTIYEGLQENPRRPVAVKVMRAGMVSPGALRRFEYESQLLARLRHPGIAQVYEAGTEGEGSDAIPYFAMEYIRNARTLTEYAGEKKLDVPQRLRLFAEVCDAVHHGHQKGIIHRDLKPSNILVDSQGHPRIIDFGVAHATDSDMALTNVQTEVGQIIGSLQYMSPEQFAADPHDIDTRSDIYALGVVLYELLRDELPYDLTRTQIHEAARIVTEQDPRKLSDGRAALGGDIETIVQKAMEKDRDRRYQSAFGLAQDIRRYLKGEAIMARPPSMNYQFRVFARRNKGLLGAVGAVFVVLVAGIIVSTTLFLNAERSRDLAEEQLVRALELRRKTLGWNDPGTVQSMEDVELIYDVQGRFGEAADLQREIVTIQSATLGPEKVETLAATFKLATTLSEAGRLGESEGVTTGLISDCRRVLGPEDELTLAAEIYLAGLGMLKGHLEESEEASRALFDRASRAFGSDHPVTHRARSQFAATLIAQGRLSAAAELYENRHLPAELGIVSSFQGQLDPRHEGPQVLVFWEAWCPFSQRAVPVLETFYRRYGNRGLDVVGVTEVNRTATNESVEAYIQDREITFPIVKENGRLGDYFGQPGTPFIVVLSDGVMVWENRLDTPVVLPSPMLQGLLGSRMAGE